MLPSITGGGSTTIPARQFSPAGLVIVAVVIWVAAQSATGQARAVINLLLLTLLVSMLVMRWPEWEQILFRG